ncbi:RluA family pseudouridine synthase [filamentous cyanobacterium LEGE 11480]|uniref:Pseudouridine synthase n=1 Tax=Romeriopsis navalis LEGE 11480 TaxID=2777977 RepID=A0A928Z543_9CYAN|nr:RluA family pseudouridine synthase [Romeriopsis navalis]MBE9030860.1 RluA family pseudouridine synthase [Romeriopsis navalis LEGE 11480]
MTALIELEAESSANRLDAYLAQQLVDLSRSRLQKLIGDGQVTVNGAVCSSKKAGVDLGDLIQITIPDAEPMTLIPEAIPLDILYEDPHLIVVNKAAGMVVHPSIGHTSGTLVNALLAHCAAQGETLPGINGVQRPGIVHRLDKDTTGAIVVAKTEQAFVHLQEQFRVKSARRSYLAVVFGSPREDSGTVDAAIGRHPVDRLKMAVVDASKGRHAVTHWSVQERIGNHALLQFDLETGRTHQIRVHAAHMGFHVIGDPTYTPKRRSVKVKLPGQALHAWRLRLIHPMTGEVLEATAPLPPSIEKLLMVLRQRM